MMLPTLKHFFDCIPVNALIKKEFIQSIIVVIRRTI